MIESKEPDLLDCVKCGEFASQAMDVKTERHGMVLETKYYCHCFSGDCGAEGPRVTDSNQSILLWNAMQSVQC
jgi:hypothetical protein